MGDKVRSERQECIFFSKGTKTVFWRKRDVPTNALREIHFLEISPPPTSTHHACSSFPVPHPRSLGDAAAAAADLIKIRDD